MKSLLEIFNKSLEGKEWLCEFLSIADFSLFEWVELVNDIDSQQLEAYLNLWNFMKRFNEMSYTKAYKRSDKFVGVWVPPGLGIWSNVSQ